MCYSLWYNAPMMMPAGSLEAEELRFQDTGRHCNECISPQAVTYSLVLLKIGKIISRNMLSQLGLLKKELLLHLVGCLYYLLTK